MLFMWDMFPLAMVIVSTLNYVYEKQNPRLRQIHVIYDWTATESYNDGIKKYIYLY